MLNELEPFPFGSNPDALAIWEHCYKDTRAFFRTFLPDNFTVPPSSLHNKMIDLCDLRKPKKRVAIGATRGIGKTTTMQGIAAKRILYADCSFLVYIGNSSTYAEMQTENLKKDLLGEDIKKCFGDIRIGNAFDVDESWSKKCWVASLDGGKHNVFVLPRGALQQVRGLLWKAPNGRKLRPDLIIVDDLEDPKLIGNDLMRMKLKEWFFSDVMQGVSKLNPNWEVLYADTLKHEDSLLQLLLESPEWDSVRLSICDEQYKTLAPDFMSDKDLEEMVEEHRNKGIMDVFAREVMCLPISKETATFKSSMFQYYAESDPDFLKRLPHIVSVVIIDPNKSVTIHSGESGLVVWGIDLEQNMLYLRYAVGERLHADQIHNRAIELALQFKAYVIGIEDTGSGEFMTYPLENEIVRRALPIEVIALKARRGQNEYAGPHGGKLMRISSLEGWYRKGLVKHNRMQTGAYELQLLGFPHGKRKDIADAAAYITEMLDVGGRFFSYWVKDSDIEDPKLVEQEYRELEKEDFYPEDAVPVSWRISP